MDDFAGKVALITGAGRGIGREIARGFSSLGAIVAANDINPINLDETVDQIMQTGGNARAYVFDIAKRMPIEGMLSQVLDHFGRIDFLVNCASVEPEANVLDMDEWEFHRTLDVNLGGPFFCIQQVGRVMRTQGSGAIVNLISTICTRKFIAGSYSPLSQSIWADWPHTGCSPGAFCLQHSYQFGLPWLKGAGINCSATMGYGCFSPVGENLAIQATGRTSGSDQPGVVSVLQCLCVPDRPGLVY